jgi:hypothetical protein
MSRLPGFRLCRAPGLAWRRARFQRARCPGGRAPPAGAAGRTALAHKLRAPLRALAARRRTDKAHASPEDEAPCVIEEAFVAVFCDLLYGSGWMDLTETEEAERESNWELVRQRRFSP